MGMRAKRSTGVRGRDAEFPGEPFHVSDTRRTLPQPYQDSRQSQDQPRRSIPERPSTSGGVASRKILNKRETRDDLQLLLSPNGAKTYHDFSLPTPNNTTDDSLRSHAGAYDQADSAHQLDYMSNAPMDIGMALGSPNQRNLPMGYEAHVRFERSRNDSPEPSAQDDWKNGALPVKSKSSKWNVFGLFGKKPRGNQANFYQSQPEGGPVVNNGSLPTPPNSADRPTIRGRAMSERKSNKNTPEVQRSQTMPLDFKFDNLSKPRAPAPQEAQRTPDVRFGGGPMLNVDIPSVELERYSIMFGSVLRGPTTASSSSLLARRQATLDKLKTVNEAIAEHERKQAETKAHILRSRRATSPQPTKSPSFSLFPGTSARRDESPPLPSKAWISPLQRSNTSPAALSPIRQQFMHRTDVGDGEYLEPPCMVTEEHTIMLAATPPLMQTWSDNSQLLLDSPTSTDDEYAAHVASPLKPRIHEPDWEMIVPPISSGKDAATINSIQSRALPTPQLSISSKSSSVSTELAPASTQTRLMRQSSLNSNPPNFKFPQRSDSAIALSHNAVNHAQVSPPHSQSSSNSSTSQTRTIRTTETPTILTSDADLEDAEARLKSAADVSIARQISISRRQRQLFLPIQARMGGANAHSGTMTSGGFRLDGVSSGLGIGMDRVIINEKKVMTPTLVDIGRERREMGPGGLGVKGNLRRKHSEKAVIERGDS